MAAQRSKGAVLSFCWVIVQGHIQMTAQPLGLPRVTRAWGRGAVIWLLHGSLKGPSLGVSF